jgi:thioredoxin 1
MIKLIDFYADWCAPCKVMEPVIEEIRKEYEGKVTVEEVDVDANQALSSSHGVMSIPTYLVLKDDQEVGRLIGVNPKSRLVEIIDSALS